MKKYVLKIDGMRCGMCEMHVEDIVRKNFRIQRVKASHLKNVVVVFSLMEITEEEFINAFEPTGYRIESYTETEAVKKLIGWR